MIKLTELDEVDDCEEESDDADSDEEAVDVPSDTDETLLL